GGNNTAVGYGALMTVTSGFDNTALGCGTLVGCMGNYNTGCGSNALTSVTSGSGNTSIGYQSNVSSGTLTNATAIGYQASVAASNAIQLGNTSVTAVNTSGTITASGLRLPTTGGTATSLTYYEEYSWVTTLTGGGQTVNITYPIVRVGSVVTITLPGFGTSGALSTVAILASGVIPARFLRSGHAPYQFMMCQSGSTTQIGNLGLYNPGGGTVFVYCYGTVNGSQFPGGYTVGFFPNVISWTLN
ncbi:MAG: hypothetical protein P4L41_06905, partial [Flavipsychrobacter sp.]|nr:hypothetical protein [Flavipsychrobacter sp.]